MVSIPPNPSLFSVAESEIRKQLEHEIRMEVEFLLSPVGLKENEIFAKMINESKTHSVPITDLLNLEKLRALGISRFDLMNALAESTAVEFNGEGTGVRPKEIAPIEDYEPQPSKKIKTDSIVTQNGDTEEGKSENYVPKLFKVTFVNGDNKMKDVDIQKELKKELKINIDYLRMNGKEGYFVVNSSTLTEEDKTKVASEVVKINDIEVKIQECWDEDLDQFYYRHKRHMKALFEGMGIRSLEAAKDEVDLVFYNKKYNDINPLIYIFQSILSKSIEGEAVKKADQQLLFELLTYHNNFEEIVRDLDYFTVGKDPQVRAEKCFFIVKKDGTKMDFVFEECLENLTNKYFETRNALFNLTS